jgi:hypothetical protein
MRARRGLISSSFLVLLLPLILVSCGGGGSSETTQSATTPPPPPAPVSLLYRTDTTLVRSQTDGSGQVLVADEPAGFDTLIISSAQIVYETPQIPPTTNHEDLWAVQTDGTNRHQLVRDLDHETHLRDVIGPWVLYDARPGRSFEPPPPSLVSLPLAGGVTRTLMDAVGSGELWQSPNYERQIDGRATFEFAGNLFSQLPDGTDQRPLTNYPPFPHFNEPFTVWNSVSGAVGSTAIFSVIPIGIETPKLFSVPLLGGPVVPLGDGIAYEFLRATTATRAIYQQCVLVRLPNFDQAIDQCDVLSVLSTGVGRVALTATLDINYVQGMLGSQVLIRRSQRGGTVDTLLSLPVTGGAELTLVSLTRDEFVAGIVAGRVILQRPTGLWSLSADGRELIQLTDQAEAFSFGAADPFVCFARGSALWCVPADGSGPATKVTDHGQFVAGL